MGTEWPCLYCGKLLEANWARPNQKFCDSSCQASFWYRKRYKLFYDNRYKQLKKEWEKSVNGKRAGVPIRVWLRLPKDWR